MLGRVMPSKISQTRCGFKTVLSNDTNSLRPCHYIL